MSPIIEPAELLKLDPLDYLLFDASAGAKVRYAEKHLAGAQYVDLDEDLAAVRPNAAEGGRHPLPDPVQFGKLLGKLGIDQSAHVIVYDDKQNSNAAARFWWMLRAAGHQKVQVINGGFDAAVSAGFPVNSTIVIKPAADDYQITQWNLPLADMDEVEKASKTGNQTIIDVRSKERFDGINEPIDTVAGHIPGAINVPFTSNLDKNGAFLTPGNLKKQFKGLSEHDHQSTIVHCGSGVTACHLLLAMDHAGLPLPKLYVGSWSEWSRNGKEMVTL
ncbi:MAG: sulfurtransferase [Pedobacter sp.]|nr:sulfurtransferase [Pedobacter sp.]MDQ8052949.1 sulfurtransferase [Pedobacter sp.]